MPFHFVTICLLVLLGAVMTLGAPCQYISKNLKQNHDSIARGLKLVDLIPDPLFTSNNSCQRYNDVRLMSATLEVYAHIFSSILQQKPAAGPDRHAAGPGARVPAVQFGGQAPSSAADDGASI
ncbi:hypothetical protein fugu_019890 [Takifugu bimaculatus]|uniref:Uncharacterized protein n=1 Tax=Takifugu bimaculatus TaxID=433685 RepID=A0A4Z2BJZ7_9TELE|nr:hypothetical protein fugu_019890 [Takifugu bimaculatus]